MPAPSQQIYWADGAGSRVVYETLQQVLADLRNAVLSDRAIAVYRPTGAGRGYYVLSDSAGPGVDLAIGNERLLLNQRLNLETPSTVAGLVAASTLRPFRIGFGSALSIPWVDAHGRGVVLIGVQDPSVADRSLERLHTITDARRLALMLNESRLNGTLNLQRQMSSAVRSLLDGGLSGGGRVGRLNALVATARQVFGSDTAYLALPEEGDAMNYYFASLSNVKTPQFRQLRMQFGQGLGGLARRKSRVVRSLKYADDDRLLAPPVVETFDEGILSAMAAPLIRSDSVAGVLYIGNRTPTPYSDTDEQVLEEFADYISLLMNEPDYRSAVRDSRTNRLREDFAHAIHDSVVRSLVQIGFTAEQVSMTMEREPAAESIAVIQLAAEEALTNLREELSGLTMPAESVPMRLGQVLDQLTGTPVGPGVTRNVYVLGSAAEERLPADVAEAMVHIGGEALTNSMLHSAARGERIEATASDSEIGLVIADDGVGYSVLGIEAEQLSSLGHFGLASMYRRAARINAHLEITSAADQGTTVSLRVPRTWSR